MAKKILIVDDEPDVLKVAVFRLKKHGYEILQGIDGMEAFDLAKEQQPDLILLDMRLPKMCGDDVCRRLKAEEALKHIPVILFTASTVGINEKMAASSAQDFLLKPFNPEELLSKVRKFLG